MKRPIRHAHSSLFSCFPFVEPLQTIHRIGRRAAACDYAMADPNNILQYSYTYGFFVIVHSIVRAPSPILCDALPAFGGPGIM